MAASSSTSTCYPCYDVFINHRGCDVKNTFASDLYRRLCDFELQVFLDKDELVKGLGITPQIEESIKRASVQIAIFSPNYAESVWCLDELVSMVKSRATIIPVFYQVEPCVLRWTIGTYGHALQKLEQKTSEGKQRYEADRIQSWRNALSSVADISGFVLSGDEGQLLDEVVKAVLKNVSKTPLDVARYSTGLAKKLEDFESMLSEQEEVKTEGAKVVGIWGVGGIGKTTLAKHFFNLKRSEYASSCFLSEVRENARRTRSLRGLQSELLNKLKPTKTIKISPDGAAIGILKKHLLSCHALVILDDVDDIEQMEAFLPIKDDLSPGSLILVTSRDKHVLIGQKILESSIYTLKGLDGRDSAELFCRYAFHQHYPQPEFEGLVVRFVKECAGSPLSLKVFGARVCGENASYWEDILDKLHQKLPSEIQDRLSISYEKLDENDKSIFLDIVFFHLGENIDTARKIWGYVGVRNLENKCLLEVGGGNKIRMHDHVRDMGRGIATQGSMPLRLSEMSEIDGFLQRPSGNSKVRGISMVHGAYFSGDVCYSEMSLFKRWRHEVLGNLDWKLFNKSRYYGMDLEILATEDGYLKAILRRFSSPQLKWLRWYRCPYTRLPFWVPLNNLRVLEVRGSRLKMLWQYESQAPRDLRELNIFAPLSHFPRSIGQLQHLEKIVVDFHSREQNLFAALSHFPRSIGHLEKIVVDFHSRNSVPLLETLPEEFGDLRSLKYLQLGGCIRMMSLPESFGKLTSLQHLDLEGACSLQSLSNSFGKLTQLKHLNLTYCRSLKMSSETLVSITTLEYLNLVGCKNVNDSLFSQAARQPSLKTLLLEGTDLKQFPRAIGDLANLEVLGIGGNISGMSNMMEEFLPLLHCLGNLRELSISSCSELKSLPDAFGLLTQLEHLSVKDCPNLKCLPAALGQLTQLKKLCLWDCGIEHLPENFLSLKNLQELVVSFCPLRKVPFKKVEREREGGGALNKLDSKDKCMFGLTDLDLRYVNISEVAFPEGVCPNLQFLRLQDCKQLREMEICGLANLRKLLIMHCANLEELPSLETLVSLEHIQVESCPKVKNIQGLAQLTKLSALHVKHCDELRELPGVERVMSLKVLDVQDCSKLQWDDAVLEKLRPLILEREREKSVSRQILECCLPHCF